MTRRILATLALAASVGAAVAAYNSSPAATTEPGASFGPVATPEATDSTQSASPAAPSTAPSDNASPMESVAPSAS